MQSTFDPERFEWRTAWPGRVGRHDLFYGSPPEDPTEGIPLGNGEVGVLLWCEPSRIIMAVNRSDLLDDPVELDRLRNWSPAQEENSPTQRHAGRIIVDFALPIFDPFYLADFQARLSLADATCSIHAAGPLGEAMLRVFVDHEDGGIHAVVHADLCDPVSMEAVVRRFGSRTFGHWYSQVKRDPAVGLAGTEAYAEAQLAVVTQRLSTGVFALGLRTSGRPGTNGEAVSTVRRHSHEAAIVFPRQESHEFELHAAVTSPMEVSSKTRRVEAIALVRDETAGAVARGFDAAHEAHAVHWREFWSRSFMQSGDDYLDNLWHLTMYYAAASQRGRFPGRFVFGQWGWNRDVQHWTFYFHWNQQQVYWPLNAAGHHDLLTSYLEYRFASLEHAEADARERLGADGAVVSDVADWHGRNSEGELENHTPVAQIALDFWRQYRYTGDNRFLEERALPYLVEAAAFFESLFEPDGDGRFHARRGTGYEGWIPLRDGITELACARALFAAVAEALEIAGATESRASRWRELNERLAPLPIASPEACFDRSPDGTLFARGAFKGQRSFGERTLAAGWGIKEERILSSKVPVDPDGGEQVDPFTVLHRLERNETVSTAIREDMKVFDGIFPFVEYSAVFPSGVVGLADHGTELFQIAADTAKLYSPDCMGWDPLPIVLARLGLGEELESIIRAWPSRWQYHCNGFGHYGPRDIQKAEASLRFRTNIVRDADATADDSRFPFSMWPFRHMGMESMSVLACAMNESLLQSHEGVIRVAPAAPESRDEARFTLHAVGGFVVSSELAKGRPRWVAVESRRGGLCRIENPWPKSFVLQNGTDAKETTNPIVSVSTNPGDRILIVSRRDELDRWETVEDNVGPNGSYKRGPLGWAQLGLPRMF